MQNIIHALNGFLAIRQIPNIALYQAKIGMVYKIFQIVTVSRGKIIQASHFMSLGQKIFAKIGSYKSCSAGYQNAAFCFSFHTSFFLNNWLLMPAFCEIVPLPFL